MIKISVKTYCRTAGVLLVLSMIGGWFGEVQIPSRFMRGDAAAAAVQLRLHEDLFRLGFAAYLVEALSDLVLAWLFYVLLKPVHRDLALLSAFFGLVSMSLFAVMKMFYFSAPLLLEAGRYGTGFSPEQHQGLAKLFLSLYGNLSGLFTLIYGSAWILRGYLTFKSGYLPRILGALMIAAGAGFVVNNITKVLAPAYSSPLLLAPMFFNVVVLAIWMLVRGVDPEKWDRATNEEEPAPSF